MTDVSKTRILQSANIVSLAFALVMNGLVGASVLPLPSIAAVSDTYATLLTPAGYAFAIWGLIYTLLIFLTVYQARGIVASAHASSLPKRMGWLFAVSNLLNGLWTVTFVSGFIGVSVIVIAGLAVSLYFLLFRLRIALDERPLREVAFVWWPLLVYTGWVTIATVVNIAAFAKSIGIAVTPIAAIIVLIVVTALLIGLLVRRNARELLLSSAWGIAAIGVAQISGTVSVAVAAFVCAGILLAASFGHGIVQSVRGNKPFLTS